MAQQQNSPITLVPLLLILLLLPGSCLCDQNLITRTCKNTPSPSLCVSSLRSDHRSSTADLHGLARIMVDVVNTKATTTHNHIKHLLHANPNPKLRRALSSCSDKYLTIIAADVAQASQAVDTGDYKFAVDAANDAAAEANNCETAFGGTSPMSGMNRDMHSVSLVTSAIVTMLM